MKLPELKELLGQHYSKTVRFILPAGSRISLHTRVTEAAQVCKRFVDCGETFRTDSVCRLQTWFQDDTDHRLSAGKLLKILDKSAGSLQNDSLEVEVEHEAPFISQFPIVGIDLEQHSISFRLGVQHTDCLVQDRCVPREQSAASNSNLFPASQNSPGADRSPELYAN